MFRIHQNMWIFFLTYINLEISSNVLKEVNKVKFSRSPFECYFTEVISPNNILITLAIHPPPPMSSFFQTNLSGPPSESFKISQRSALLGSQLWLIPPYVLPKIKWCPLKFSAPLPHPINNDRSLSIYSYFSRLTVQVLGKNRWNHWLRYFHTFAEGGTVMSGEQREERVSSASPLQVTK